MEYTNYNKLEKIENENCQRKIDGIRSKYELIKKVFSTVSLLSITASYSLFFYSLFKIEPEIDDIYIKKIEKSHYALVSCSSIGLILGSFLIKEYGESKIEEIKLKKISGETLNQSDKVLIGNLKIDKIFFDDNNLESKLN